MKAIVLAEKPSVAREIARVLNCNVKGKGYLEGNKYVVTWALGHLVTLAEPDDYDKRYKTWRMEDLPMMPNSMKLKVIRQTYNQFQAVRGIMKRGDISELIIATDAGREGELVARWIMEEVGWKKPFRRLWISSQTDNAILEGFKNLKPGKDYNSLYDAAVCRAEADWLIGLNVTRALTCKYNAQLTAGRVQTPTLAMIIDREEEIKKFTPVDYWTISADFDGYTGEWRDKNRNGRIFDNNKAEEIAQRVRNSIGTIKEVKTEPKTEPAPLAYDLTELQRDANRRLGFSAQKTLSVLQGLYENHKIVTYPRTDSRYISSDIVPTLPIRLKSMGTSYSSLIKPLLEQPIKTTKRFVDDSKVSDHHAIIPTEQTLNIGALDRDERMLYDLIAKRFIAVLYPPYKYDQTTIVTEASGESFYSKGRVVKDLGWRAVEAKPQDTEKDDEDNLRDQTLMVLKKGETKKVKGCKVNKLKTKPPARYNEASLLTAMESPGKLIEDEELRESIKQGGLGTPATRAEIIEKLLYNNYIERHGKELVPTSKGMQLIKLAPEELRSPELTAQWELRLSNIAKGRENKVQFINDIRKDAIGLVQNVITDEGTFKADNVTRNKCPMCGKYMLLINSKKGKMLSCPDRNCGYREKESKDDNVLKKSRNEIAHNQRLISKFSDKDTVGNSLGDLLKAAMEKKEE
ncbi:DNA topoisomerase 3 [Oxobacter pfennigii]|uniref:DNA topoisomerase n=1 Tax=Oxobacter pfennigii TaxID=36849 RepID=A0A0P8WQD0_9CLOT|nr:DNA topoisomerase III [Oxobacter pfennigii]KPU44753.1 DNA topoisomerase 3 [Oxobacter pfennigii]